MRLVVPAGVALAACSDVYYPIHDAAFLDAPHAPVTVRLGASTPGVHVYFQDGPREPANLVITDAVGQATGDLAAGGMVTVVDPYGTALGGDVRTFAGIGPGATLVLVPNPEGVVGGPHIKVRVPIDSTPGVTYQLRAPCTQLGNPVQVTAGYAEHDVQLEGCGPSTDLLIYTELPNGTVSRSLFAENVAIADQAVIDLASRSYYNAAIVVVGADQVPLSMASSELTIDHGTRNLYTARAGVVPMMMSSATLSVPYFAGAVYNARVLLQIGSELHTLVQHVLAGGTAHFFVWPLLLSSLIGCPVISAATRSVDWTESRIGQVASFAAAVVVAQRGSKSWTWSLIGPADGSLEMPVLGAGDAAYMISEGDTVRVGDFYRARVPGGYASVLEGPLPTPSWMYLDLRLRDETTIARALGPPAGCL